MAANDIGNFISIPAPESFKNYDSDIKSLSSSQENVVDYDVVMKNSYDEELKVDWDKLFGVVDS